MQESELTEHNASKVEIRPGVGLYALFPSLRYSPWVALGELVDNSIQSYLEHQDRLREIHGDKYQLRVDITFVGGTNPTISVVDNAAGIFDKDFSRAFVPAMPPRRLEGISQYGIGMKSSACWFSKYFTVRTRALNEPQIKTVIFDVDKIIKEQIHELVVEKEIANNSKLHGTRIILSQLNQPLPIAGAASRVRSYLRSMYRDFIRSGELILTINGEVIEFRDPNWLIAPYWPTDKGPQSSSDLKWTKEFEFTLDESFQESPNLDAPPVIRGKVGILDKGDTKRAGLSLIWRRKVVQGAGNLADSPDDLYRPAMIYGGSNSFERQRIIGEIDVSDLKVTSFKDSVVWQGDQEEELLKKLKEVLSNDDLPILKMARNYRARTVSEQQNYIAKEVLADVTARMATSLQNSLQKSDLNSNFVSTRDLHETEPNGEFERAFTSELRLIPRFNSDVILELRFNSNDPEWLRVRPAESRRTWLIIVNGSHPFMESFTSANSDSLEPVLRLALAIAIAEIQGISSGFESSQFLRLCINDLLKNELSSRSELEELESKNE